MAHDLAVRLSVFPAGITHKWLASPFQAGFAYKLSVRARTGRVSILSATCAGDIPFPLAVFAYRQICEPFGCVPGKPQAHLTAHWTWFGFLVIGYARPANSAVLKGFRCSWQRFSTTHACSTFERTSTTQRLALVITPSSCATAPAAGCERCSFLNRIYFDGNQRLFLSIRYRECGDLRSSEIDSGFAGNWLSAHARFFRLGLLRILPGATFCRYWIAA